MAQNLPPRQVIKGLLQGIAPAQPLFLPIAFAHGAHIENLSLRDFLGNPTKIFNSLRQIRAHLRADGIACYFDPLLEAEALGGTIDWSPDGWGRSLRWSQHAVGELPDRIRPADEAARASRVAVAAEVIRRFKAVVRDDCVLMASVTGPITLGALLADVKRDDGFRYQDVPAPALDLATDVMSAVAKSFVEAGANVILAYEELLPAFSVDDGADWMSRLATTINIVRFYEALPVVILGDNRLSDENADVLVNQLWDCIVCPETGETVSQNFEKFATLGNTKFGIALPSSAFATGLAAAGGIGDTACQVMKDLRPAIVTTAGDLPLDADMERLKKVWENIRG